MEPEDQSGCTDFIAIAPSNDANEVIRACDNSTIYSQTTDRPALR